MEALQITKLLTNSKTIVGAINELYNKIKSSNGGIFYLGYINKDSTSEQILEAIGGNWDSFIEKINGDYILLHRDEEHINRMPLFWSYENGNEVYITFWNGTDLSIFSFIQLCITKNDTTYSCAETEYKTLVGDPTQLQTTNKTIIGAINEIYNSISAQTGVYIISELTNDMPSEDISSAIGGWDNLLQAIKDKRTILMYNGSIVSQAIYYNNITIATNLRFIIPNTGNTNIGLNSINITITNVSNNLTVNRTQIPVNTEDINNLQTDNKTLVGGINELLTKINNIEDTSNLPYIVIKPNNFGYIVESISTISNWQTNEILEFFGITETGNTGCEQLFNLISSFKNKSLILFKEKDNDENIQVYYSSALGIIGNLDISENSLELTLTWIRQYSNTDFSYANVLFQISKTEASVNTIKGGNILSDNDIYSNLTTSSKKIIGAINELNSKLNNIIPVVELTTQIDFSLNNADIELSSEELIALSKVKDNNQIALSFKQSNTPYKVYSVSKYNNTSGSITSFTFNLSDTSIIGNYFINCSFVLTLTVSRAAIKIINLNTVYPILLEGLNKTSPNQTDVQNAIGKFTEIKNAIDTGKNIIALDNYDTYKENIKIIYTKATNNYILIGVIISNSDFPTNGFIYRLYRILNNYNIFVYDIPVHKAIEFEDLKSITNTAQANTVMSKYTIEELIFAQTNGIPFINKYDVAGGIPTRDRIISVIVDTSGITFIYFNNNTDKFYKLVLTYASGSKDYTFIANQPINN